MSRVTQTFFYFFKWCAKATLCSCCRMSPVSRPESQKFHNISGESSCTSPKQGKDRKPLLSEKITSTSTERQKRSQNSAPVLVIISGNSLIFSRKIITSTDFYRYCAPNASAPVVVINQSPILPCREYTQEPRREATSVEAGTRDRTNHIAFAEHFLVGRYKNNELCSYMMACRHPGHQHCSKEMSKTVAGSLELARRMLKTWALMAPQYGDRSSYMGKQGKDMLLETHVQKTLLTEAELDEIAQVGFREGREAPLQPQPASARERPHPVGQRESSTPAAVHQKMEELCQQGLLPATSLQQRQRNKLVSIYNVPSQLEEALQHRYIHPNLPPPAGLRWRHQRNEWHLVPRGG